MAVPQVIPQRRLGRALLICVGAAFLLFLPAWLAPTTRVVGFGGDTQLQLWFLAWTPAALSHFQNPLVTDAINHPLGVNLMWNTLMLLPGLVAAPFTIWLGPVFSDNLLSTAALALSGWCAFIAIRDHVVSDRSALIAALLYELCPFMLVQATGHLPLIFGLAPPLVLLAVQRIVRERWKPVRGGVVLGIVAGLQLIISEETLALTMLSAAVLLVALAVTHRTRVPALAPRLLQATGVAIAVAAVIDVYPLVVQFLGPRPVHGLIQPSDTYVSDLAGFVTPPPLLAMSPPAATELARRFTGNLTDADAYLGIPLLIALTLIAWKRRADARVRVATWATGALALLSLGPHLHVAGQLTSVPLPWWLVQRSPLYDNALPSRLALEIFLGAAVIIGVGADSLRTRHRVAATLLGATVVATLFPALPYPTTADATPQFFRSGGGVETLDLRSVAVVLPFAHQVQSSDAMQWQAEAGDRFAMVDGYFVGPGSEGAARYGPPSSPLVDALESITDSGTPPTLTQDLRRTLLEEMSDDGVRELIVGPMEHRQLAEAFAAWLTNASPERTGGVALWRL